MLTWLPALALGLLPSTQVDGTILLAKERDTRFKKQKVTAFVEAIDKGVEWLVAHQHPDGYWDSDGFPERCSSEKGAVCGGTGDPVHDVGLTGLALLALLGAGNDSNSGEYADEVAKGVDWLLEQQDPKSGLIGERLGHFFLYTHAIATIALAEDYVLSRRDELHEPLEKAVAYSLAARNPKAVWRYDVPPTGDNDTSITAWMAVGLLTAREAGITVDGEAFDASLAWIEQVTDEESGRVGYDSPGTASARVSGVNDDFDPDREAMTGAGMLLRFLLGQNPKDHPILRKHALLLQEKPPVWDVGTNTIDMYAWYYGALAMHQLGGKGWKSWMKEMKKAVVKTQIKKGHSKGSWDPVGAWGMIGGRVYSTAMMTLIAETHYRYGRAD